jgi:hypothetical protein
MRRIAGAGGRSQSVLMIPARKFFTAYAWKGGRLDIIRPGSPIEGEASCSFLCRLFTNLSPILLVSRPGNLPAERCEVRRVGLPIWIRSNRKSGSPARSHALPMAGRGQADFDAGIGPIAEPADLRGDHIDAALKLLVLWSDLARCGRVWKLSAPSGWRYRDMRFATYGREQMAPRHLRLVRDGVNPVFKGLLVATPDSCDWLSGKCPDSLHEKGSETGPSGNSGATNKALITFTSK